MVSNPILFPRSLFAFNSVYVRWVDNYLVYLLLIFYSSLLPFLPSLPELPSLSAFCPIHAIDPGILR